MTSRFAFIAFFLSLAMAGFGAEGSKPVKVFIFAGQSNMVGADAHPEQIDDYPVFKGAGAPQTNVLYSFIIGRGEEVSKGWVPLKPLSSFGPELTFARAVRGRDDSPIAIIKSAAGGTTVAYDWNPDAPDKGQKLYPLTLNLIRESLRELDAKGIAYHLEAVMWHQGENDMLDRNLNTQYAEGLTKLIGRFRKDLDAPELKWFMAEVSEKGIWGMDNRHNLSILRQQQQKVLDADPLVRWVPTSHLAFEVMGNGQPHYHFGTQGQLQLGEAFATAYLREIGKPLPSSDRAYMRGLVPIGRGARIHLFVLAGQRNMEGEDAYVSAIPEMAGFESLARRQPKVIFRYSLGGGVKVSPTWEPLGPVDYLGTFGPELSLGLDLRRAVHAREGVALVKFTHSGAQGPDWFPQGSAENHRSLYPKLIRFIGDAVNDLNSRGYDTRLEGVFWHTGENDTYFEPYRRNYAAWMKQLIDQTRIDLIQPNLPWFISEQQTNSIWKNGDTINAALNAMAATNAHVSIIKTSELPRGRVHFGAKGTLMLGDAMAQAYLKSR